MFLIVPSLPPSTISLPPARLAGTLALHLNFAICHP